MMDIKRFSAGGFSFLLLISSVFVFFTGCNDVGEVEEIEAFVDEFEEDYFFDTEEEEEEFASVELEILD